MKCRWSIAPPQPVLAGKLANESGVSPLLAQCLLNRGVRDVAGAAGFLQPKLKTLGDPFDLPNMRAAVERLIQARSSNERMVIFGDYDVDGVTSTALLLEVLSNLGWAVDYYLPNRADEGYGLSQEGLENCLRKYPVSLLLAVDCGSSSAEMVSWLREKGVDVIVLDHHQVSHPPPAATALVNPQLSGKVNGAPGRFQELCSVGLAFKLAHALVKEGREQGWTAAALLDIRQFLDLVALGTIADIVPLIAENRILVTAGLQRLAITRRAGLRALKQVAGCPLCPGTYEVGFQLAPRLNAAGRLESAEDALKLLLATKSADALCLAEKLNTSNAERQRLEKNIALQAVQSVASQFDPSRDYVVVAGNSDWHIGVVGIVASRVCREFYRPTIIVGGSGETLRGSGRSIAGFDLAAALAECSDLLVRHGGHSMAAGLSVLPGRLEAFRDRLNDVAHRKLTPEALMPLLRIDAEVGLEEISIESLTHLEQVNPTGQGNPALHFLAGPLTHARPLQRVGKEKQHVKMWVTDGSTTHEAVWWGAGQGSLPTGRFQLAFAPGVSEYNGRRSVQLKVLDWRPVTNDQQSPLLGI